MIRGELTNLRAIERTDALAVHAWLNAAIGASGWPHTSGPISLAEAQRRVESWIDEERTHRHAMCLVCDDLDSRSCGLILFTHFERDHRAVEFDLLFVESLGGETGIIIDALRSVTELCFEQWNLHRLTARIPIDDTVRSAAFTSCGYRCDALSRQAAYFDGEYHDVAVFCLLETDDLDSAS